MNLQDIRKQFDLIWSGALENEDADKKLIYLDSAATSQKPSDVINSIINYYRSQNANIHRGMYDLSIESTKLWHDAHVKVADFIHARSYEEVIFTRNATEAINLVATSFGRTLKEGDVVVITEMEHHSNILPWLNLAKERGVKVEWLSVLDDFTVDLEYLHFLIRKYGERLKLLSIVHLSNVLGTYNDVRKIADMVHEVGAKVLVDIAQSVVHDEVNVKALGADFAVFSGHKLYAPTGIGVLYAKKSILNEIEPYQFGGEMIKSVTKLGATWNDLPYKFEAGTPNIEGGVALASAIDWMKENAKWEDYKAHSAKVMSMLVAGLKGINEVKIFGTQSSENRASLVSFTVKGIHPHDISSLLNEEGVAVRAGFHCAEPLHRKFNLDSTVRASLGVYNNEEEIRYFIEALKKSIQKFK